MERLIAMFVAFLAVLFLVSCEAGVHTIASDQDGIGFPDQDVDTGPEIGSECENENFMACSGSAVVKCLAGQWTSMGDCADYGMVCVEVNDVAGCTSNQPDYDQPDYDWPDNDHADYDHPDVDPQCGNGVTELPEVCDGNQIACSEIGEPGTGYAVCKNDCSGYDAGNCVATCVVMPNATFFDDMPTEWASYFTMTMSGLINAMPATDPDFAFLAKATGRLLGTTYNLASSYGLYFRDSVQDAEGNTYPVVIGMAAGNLTWPVSNKLASLWVGQISFVVEDLINWKEEAELEDHVSVTVEETYQVAVSEIWVEISGSDQYTRMECTHGLSAYNSGKTAFDGRMFACVDGNTEWAVGEQMKVMEFSKMVDDPADILAMLNEGLDTGDPDYRTDICRCYTQDVDANGTPTTLMDCDDMKAEFGL